LQRQQKYKRNNKESILQLKPRGWVRLKIGKSKYCDWWNAEWYTGFWCSTYNVSILGIDHVIILK
jgi:hypothetical protein